jgi:hypothetical protein
MNYEFPVFNTSHNPNLINQKYYKDSTVPNTLSPQQPIIDWYFINPYTTYHQNIPIDNELNDSTQKIVVNVINNNTSSTNLPKSILKSNNDETITKKRIYPSSPTTNLGSETVESLFQVRSTPSQSTSMTIDRHHPDSPDHLENEQLPSSTPITTTNTPVSITPSAGYMTQQRSYYTTEPSKTYASMPNNIYLTTIYVPNAISYYPFIYYQY